MLFAVLTTANAAEQPKLRVENDSIDCGHVKYQMPASAKYVIKNRSDRQIEIDHVDVSCGCTTVSYPKQPISGGNEFEIVGAYDAAMLGHFYKEMAVYFKGYDEPLYLKMTGVVETEVVDYSGSYPYKIGNLRINKNDIEFDNVNRGDRPVAEIEVMNTGKSAYTPVIMHLPSYLTAKAVPERIGRNHGGKVFITLDSKKLRDYGLTQTSVYLSRYPGDKVCPETEITVSSVLLPAFTNMTAQARQNAPKMVLSTKELDLGSFEGKPSKRGEITITNNGNTDLKISALQVFTSGIDVALGKRVIPAGTTEKLKIKAEQKYLKDARSKPRVLMITNDPDHSKVTIDINIKE